MISVRQKVAKSQRAHYLAAESMQRKHFVVGALAIVSATLASALTFFENNTQIAALDYIAPFLGTFAAVFASVQTFSRFLERYDQHRVAAVRYGSIARKLELTSNSDELPSILKEWEQVAESSPVTPRRFRDAATNGDR